MRVLPLCLAVLLTLIPAAASAQSPGAATGVVTDASGAPVAGAKVSLELSLDEDLPPVFANRVQIQQVLINLLTNAIQLLDSARGRSRRIAIRSVAAEGEKVLLEVSDSGNGMSPEDVHHVFDAFHTTKATGTGIGLSLCRTIVEEHGGRIWASPGEKAGATFHVQLPRSRFTGSARLSSL